MALTAAAAHANDKPPRLSAAANAAAPHANLALRGSGSFSKWFFHVFDVSLWTPDGGRWQPAKPFALVQRYARSFSLDEIVGSTVDQWKALGNTTAAERQRWLPTLRHALRDVSPGDRIAGVHTANDATVFFYNGKRTGVIKAPGFAKAFFAIWLSPKAQAPELRRNLLSDNG